ncbi:hypothetical protein J7T55_011425 [Diaporthe amygdali]|uniref:uncharacterized protein n=1 Tax=Phomopsis amygdali TaxID=1214568 RepID=UPI0022FEA30A|nr:uncharacterized protein J7T55_011425 [Diaporthe amygdali]KAJ0122964.1 hypothetical protein J7T55_011425 [Diaporthe amygdali]
MRTKRHIELSGATHKVGTTAKPLLVADGLALSARTHDTGALRALIDAGDPLDGGAYACVGSPKFRNPARGLDGSGGGSYSDARTAARLLELATTAIKRAKALQWGRFVDNSELETHRGQRVEIHWAQLTGWSGTQALEKQALRPQ